jgi:NDP-sugar pyrophosphorylase family protein
MKPTLVILAAGMASRYGSMKQVQSFGPSGETIMDYSIFDAIKAGFGKVIFIIREEFLNDFKQIFETKLAGKIEVDYVFQNIKSFVGNQKINAERTKPWGTAHAVLCCKGKINEPFAVINADDFYGADAFIKAFDFLTNQCNEKTYAILGYSLHNTLSENGSVSRGVCEVDDNHNLVSITERTKIYDTPLGIVFEENGLVSTLSQNTRVSMNYICFAPNIIDFCEQEFNEFLEKSGEELKSEFFIPLVTSNFITTGKGNVKIIETEAHWFGVTYKEDAEMVKNSITKLVLSNQYPNNLWA